MEYFDSYNIHARLAAAVLAVAPAVALALVAVSWSSFSMPDAVILLCVVALFMAFADVARRFGRRIEPALFATAGGKPSVRYLRHSDHTLDDATKTRYIRFLADKLDAPSPSLADETSNPSAADAYYERCSNWLRINSRDKQRFSVLFEENKTYGFRRNQLGLKPPGLILNLAVVASCFAVLQGWIGDWSDFVTSGEIFAIFAVAAIHAAYFLAFVNQHTVNDASDRYGMELLQTCDVHIEANGWRPKI